MAVKNLKLCAFFHCQLRLPKRCIFKNQIEINSLKITQLCALKRHGKEKIYNLENKLKNIHKTNNEMRTHKPNEALNSLIGVIIVTALCLLVMYIETL